MKNVILYARKRGGKSMSDKLLQKLLMPSTTRASIQA
jgi:hypothetical protein